MSVNGACFSVADCHKGLSNKAAATTTHTWPLSHSAPRAHVQNALRPTNGAASGRRTCSPGLTTCNSDSSNRLIASRPEARTKSSFGGFLVYNTAQGPRAAQKPLVLSFRRPSAIAQAAAETPLDTKQGERVDVTEGEEGVSENALCNLLMENGMTKFDDVDLIGRTVHPKVQKLILDSQAWPDQKSEDWWNSRKGMLTASDVGAVLGDSVFADADKVLAQKLDRIAPAKLNAAMKHGNKTETEALRQYEERCGQTCVRFGLKPHNRYKWLGASPDGVTLSGRLVEIKCPYNKKKSHRGLKIRYYAQCQILMEVFDLEVCDLVQYYKPVRGKRRHTGGSLSSTEIQRDRKWFEDKFPQLEEFITRLHSEQAADAQDTITSA